MNRKWLVLLGTGLATLIVCIDFNIVITALASIEKSLNTNLRDLQWVIIGFGLFFSVFLVVMGRVGDIIGRRKVMYIGMLGFGITSLAAGLSEHIWFLNCMRILQGFFGAAIYPTGMAIVNDVFPEEERGRALGIFGTIAGFGLAFGPVLGSIVLAYLTWHWIFFINIPIVIASFLVCIPNVSESKLADKVSIDWLGAILLVLSLGSLVFAFTQAEDYGWDSITIFTSLTVFIVTLSILIIHEKKSKAPILPTELFLNRAFVIGTLAFITATAFSWCVMFFMPLYLEKIQHYAPGQVGFILFAITIMTMIAPIFAGYAFDKFKRSYILYLLYACSLTGLGLFLFFNITTPLWLIILAFVIYGTSWGIGNAISIPLSLLGQYSNEHTGLVSGAVVTVMNMMGVLLLTLGNYINKLEPNLIAGIHAVTVFLIILGVVFLGITMLLWHSKQHA